jgi:PTH1 family peptidyl-tRNA hydrolase
VGFHVVDARAEKEGVRFRRPLLRSYAVATEQKREGSIVLAKPLTYMNRSGEVVPTLLAKYDPVRIVVVCDNLDLPPGSLRVKRGGTGGGHRGLASITEHLNPEEYLRFYIGIGRPAADPAGTGDRRQEIVDYVLGEPNESEAAKLAEAAERAAELVPLFAHLALDELIQRVNSSN